jgi:outer membrane protein assembly factor BamB
MALPFGLPLNVMVAPALANDWPYWRGPEQTGMTREKAPVTEWSPDGEGLLWKNDIGGRTTPVVMNGRVYTITPVGSDVNLQERVVCVDADTGQLVWEHRFNVFHTDMVENRVGWTAVVADPETGNVYAHGTGGEFFCFDRDGKVVWKRSLTEEFGRISGYGGRLHTPIIDEDKVIISFLNSSWGAHARPLHRYLAMDKKTGEVIYWAEPGGAPLDTTYACPVVTVIDGKRLLIAPNADGWIYGMLVRTGETVWSYKLSKRGLNTSPVVDGNYVYVTQSEENYGTTEMGAVLCIDASKSGDITESGTVWRHDGYTVGYCSPAIANSRLYVVSNDATMYCFDAKSGERKWRHDLGRVGKGSPVVTADGVIYVGEQNGLFHILKDEGDECRSLSRHDFARTEEGEDEFFGSPAVANGRVYFQVRSGTYCLGVRDGDRQADVAIPALASGSAPFFGLAPADVTLAPGDAWRPRLALRHLELDDEEVAKQLSELPMTSQWSLEGLDGAMSAMPDGQLKVNDDASHAAGVVSAFESKTGAARSASARVRVIPSLPFVVDFEDMAAGSAPPGWIGCGRKVKIDERDGSRVLRKLADKQFPSPPFMRLMTFVTMPLEAGYTIECDMLSEAKRGRFKPDMGLVNARYQLVAMGMSKVLRVETWAAMPRLRVDVPFEFEPDKWYIMRFTVKLEGEQARLLGKVWLRGEEEPADWMIDVVDPCPNREGSAGLYAYSAGTTAKSDGPETYFDNLKVSRNAK